MSRQVQIMWVSVWAVGCIAMFVLAAMAGVL